MKNQQLRVGLILLLLGWVGVTSMLTMNIPLPEEAANLLNERFSPLQIKLLMLINPSIMVLIAVIIGTLLYKKANLSLPIISSFFDKKNTVNFQEIIKYGVIVGLLAGVLIGITTLIFTPYLPQKFTELAESLKLSLPARFLYGGITEEILMRFGLMTFIVWLLKQITQKLNSTIYWIAIIIASIVFALGHFPVVYNIISNPPTSLLVYILIGNSIGGIIFGWLYYKKGLESAFIAHIFTHICMVLGNYLIQ